MYIWMHIHRDTYVLYMHRKYLEASMGKTQSWFSLEVEFGAWNKERTRTLTFHFRYLVLFFRFCSKHYFDYFLFRVSSFNFSKKSWASLQQCGLTHLSQHPHVRLAPTTHRMDASSPSPCYFLQCSFLSQGWQSLSYFSGEPPLVLHEPPKFPPPLWHSRDELIACNSVP